MKVLGLDLGSASIGWGLVDFSDDKSAVRFLGMGTRVIPYSDDSIAKDFQAGKGETACSKRTFNRGMRRNLDRWQLHRAQLTDLLISNGLMTESTEFPKLDALDTWRLRADAATPGCKLSLEEIARVLLHINHRRGYRHAKSDMGGGKETEYVARINALHQTLIDLGMTPGQYFYSKLKESETISPNGTKCCNYRIKEQVLTRKAYSDEVETILKVQTEFYPDVLTDEVRSALHEVIFYQRKLKSCKHLVSLCEFESRTIERNGKQIVVGPRVAPRTSPLAQVCRIYEAVNNIRLTNPRNDKKTETVNGGLFNTLPEFREAMRKHQYEYPINDEERQRIVEHMNTQERLTVTDLFRILGLKKADGFKADKLLTKGIKGNDTYVAIKKALAALPEHRQQELLRFNLEFEDVTDEETGEVTQRISQSYEHEPLYMLWHTLYSIDDRDELFKVLCNNFGIAPDDEETLSRLFAIDFVKAGYTNKSAKFMRRILPHLMDGKMYSEAAQAVGVNHSNSITAEENEKRELLPVIPNLPCGTLRQPVVEKIINQSINLINAIKERYGDIDEVRVELARELKQSKEERAETTSAINKLEKENAKLVDAIRELGIIPTRRRIRKMRMLAETGEKCIYCNAIISPVRFIEGHGYEIEHIIPRSRYFDDSFANTVCACRECNSKKGNMTGLEYMKTKPETEFNAYKERVIDMANRGVISKRKKDYLLMDGNEIPTDFLNRDLNETQYITKKMMEILRSSFRNVWASSGRVTDFLRHVWGYDEILHDLNLPKYQQAGLAETVEYETHGQKHATERIKDWSKRRDHRHHAIDALVVALTRQDCITYLNTLNTMKIGADGESNTLFKENKRNLEKWGAAQPHLSVGEVMEHVEEMAISFKGGKKLATPGKRCRDREGNLTRTLTPRAPLHKETVYGEIMVHDGRKTIKFALEHLDLVQDAVLRKELQVRLAECGHNINLTLKSLKKNPVMRGDKPIEDVPCFKREIVTRYKLSSITRKDIKSIIDTHIREVVQTRYDNVKDEKEFQAGITESPLYSDAECLHEVKAVRCFTGLNPDTLATVARDEDGKAIGFAQTRNNHHMAVYLDAEGRHFATVCSFWECIKRKRYGIPVFIENPALAWDYLQNLESCDDVEEIAKGMPAPDSTFLFTLQRNEMVVLGMSDDEWNDAVTSANHAEINRHLYRVWKLSDANYAFKFHTNTEASVKDGDKEIKAHFLLKSLSALFALNPRKVRVDLLGNVVLDKESN